MLNKEGVEMDKEIYRFLDIQSQIKSLKNKQEDNDIEMGQVQV